MRTDVHDPETRSKNMRAIGPKNTKPEILVRSYLHNAGLRFRLHDTGLPGKPDLVLRKRDAVVFVHGCYWHRHANCRFATTPKSNKEFWIEKLEGNRERDERHQKKLRKMGWNVFVIWECQTRSLDRLAALANSLKSLT